MAQLQGYMRRKANIKFYMNYIDEFAEKLGFEKKLLSGGFKFFCFSFESVLIEGHKGILVFSPEEMRFKVKGGTISILGANLRLKNFTKQSAVVCGKILKTGFEINEVKNK